MSVRVLSAFRPLLFLSVFVLFALAVSAQRLVPGSKPAKASVPEYSEAFCSNLTGAFRVCRVRTSDDGDADFVVTKGGSILNRIAATAWANVAVTPEGFFAYRGDLDNDGRAEIVLVSLEGVSNGMGVTYSTVFIFDGGTQGPPLSYSVQEFSDRESFIYDPAKRRTEMLITYWGDYASIEPKRVHGVYLIGKWFRYRGGKLEPVLEKPTLARRFLNSFAAERDNGWFENRHPYTWLKDRRTHKLFREPDEPSGPLRTETATLTRFVESSSSDGDAVQVDFTTDDGRAIKGKFGNASEDGKIIEIKAFGIWKQRYLYPLSWSMDFRPATFLASVEGRRVRLETFKTEYGDEFTKVWLLD